MTPKEKARRNIDRQLDRCGWRVQDYRSMDLSAGPGVAVRDFPLTTGFADYLLYVDRRVLEVIEAITNLEASLADNRPRALNQMAMGSGKNGKGTRPLVQRQNLASLGFTGKESV